MNILRTLGAATLAASLSLASTAALAAPSDGRWDWVVAPYIWAPSISTDFRSTDPPSTASNDTAFNDIIDKIDGVFLIHGEGQGDEFGVFADFIFLGLADSSERRFLHTESDLDTMLIEVAAVWSPHAERFNGFEAFAGMRLIDVDFDFQLIPVDPAFATRTVSVDETFNDFMLGARYTFPMSERWSATLRGDGSWGDSNGTWNASAMAHYRTEHGAWYFGWRYLDIDLEPGNRNDLSIGLNGPVVGYGFRF